MTNSLLTSQQEEARRHLLEWKVGALFMEAGTGKTRVAVELVNLVPACDVVVYICPLRTIDNVKEEIKKWGGFACQNVVFYGIESISMSDRIYLELLSLIQKYSRPFVVVDESLKIKNAEAKRNEKE